MRSILTISLLMSALIASPAMAQRGRGAPHGSEIAAKAKATRFDRSNVGEGVFQGQRMAMTPANLKGVASSLDDIKAGQVVGVLENGAAGDETGLPPGRYNLYVAYVDGQWQGYAEAGGQIVSPAIRAIVSEQPVAARAPQFHEQGWCFFVSWQQLGLLWLPGGIYLCF